jgi:hypothetical protein
MAVNTPPIQKSATPQVWKPALHHSWKRSNPAHVLP